MTAIGKLENIRKLNLQFAELCSVIEKKWSHLAFDCCLIWSYVVEDITD